MNDDKVVCTCIGVTVSAIKEAIDNGAKTMTDIQGATGAGTVCGACLEDIELVLDNLSKSR